MRMPGKHSTPEEFADTVGRLKAGTARSARLSRLGVLLETEPVTG